MTAEDKKVELASYRIKQAEESLEEARFLMSGGKSPRSVINRTYYSMFYAILALLVYEPFSSSKHSGILCYFNKRFIKEGIFPEYFGRSINKAFDLRQRGDYREKIDISYEQIKPFIDNSEQFIKAVKDYLLKKSSDGI